MAEAEAKRKRERSPGFGTTGGMGRELEKIDKVLSPTCNLTRDPEALASVPVLLRVRTRHGPKSPPPTRGHSDVELIEDDTYDVEIAALELFGTEGKARREHPHQ